MRTRIVPVIAAIGAAFLLAACSAQTSDQAQDMTSGAVADGVVTEGVAPAVPEGTGVAPDAKVGGESSPQEQSVIRTAYVDLRVEDVGAATRNVRSLVAQRNGLISYEDSRVEGESTYSSMTVQVPASGLDRFIADISSLGDVGSVSVNAQDVTTQVVDLDARIKALKSSIDRMSELLAQAEQIDDLLAIETQISSRQAELDSLTAQREFIGDQVALSSVTINISPASTITEVDAPGFLSGLRSGWAAFVSAIAVAVTAFGFLLPFAVISLLVLVPLIAIAIRQSRRRSTPVTKSEAKVPVDSTPAGG